MAQSDSLFNTASSRSALNQGDSATGGPLYGQSAEISRVNTVWDKETQQYSGELDDSEVSVCKSSSDCGSGFVCVNGVCLDQSGFQQRSDPGCGNAVDSGGSTSSGGCIDSGCVQPDPDCLAGITVCRPDGDGDVVCGCETNCTGDAECGEGFICVDGACFPAQCTELNEVVDCGFHFTCIDGRCFPDLVTCDPENPCPYGYSCVNGVCWADPQDCSTTSDCELGYACEDGQCLATCATDVQCGIGYSCRDGHCRPDVVPCDNGACPNGFECVEGICLALCDNGVCPDGYTCVDGYCYPDDYVCPPGTSLGPGGCKGSCSTFCDNYYKTYGEHGPGCNEILVCDACNECSDQSLCVTIQENNPCWCIPPQDAPYCYDCGQDGSLDLNCADCQFCGEIAEYVCSCGETIESVKLCRTACEGAGKKITDEELEEEAIRLCAEKCGTSVVCNGECTEVEYVIEPGEIMPPCPPGYRCGVPTVSGQNSSTVSLDYCESIRIGGAQYGDGSESELVARAKNVFTGQIEVIPWELRYDGTEWASANGNLNRISEDQWGECPQPSAKGQLFGLTAGSPLVGSYYSENPRKWIDLRETSINWSPEYKQYNSGPCRTMSDYDFGGFGFGNNEFNQGSSVFSSQIDNIAYRFWVGTLHTLASWDPSDPRTPSFTLTVDTYRYDISTLSLTNLSPCTSGQQLSTVELSLAPPVTRFKRQECYVEGLPQECIDLLLQGDSRLSISVIDEDDSYSAATRNEDWQQYRQLYPNTLFILLVPGAASRVGLPVGWNGLVFEVGRPNGIGEVDPGGGPWWQQISSSIPNGVKNIDMWVDDSGSMTVDTVTPDLQSFVLKAQTEGYEVIDLNQLGLEQGIDFSRSENWIAAHAYTLRGSSDLPVENYCNDPGTRVQMGVSEPDGSNTQIIADVTDVEYAKLFVADCIGSVDHYVAEIRGIPFDGSSAEPVTYRTLPYTSDKAKRPYFKSLRENDGSWESFIPDSENCQNIGSPQEEAKAFPPQICQYDRYGVNIYPQSAEYSSSSNAGFVDRTRNASALLPRRFAQDNFPYEELGIGRNESVPYRGFFVYKLDNAGTHRVDFHYAMIESFYSTEQEEIDAYLRELPAKWSRTFSPEEWKIQQYTTPAYLPSYRQGGVDAFFLRDDEKIQRTFDALEDLRQQVPGNTLANLRIPDVIFGDPTKSIQPGMLSSAARSYNNISFEGGNMILNVEHNPGTVIIDGNRPPAGEYGYELWPRSLGGPEGSQGSTWPQEIGYTYDDYGFAGPGRWAYLGATYMYGAQGVYGFSYDSVSWSTETAPGQEPELPCFNDSHAGNISWTGQCTEVPSRYPVLESSGD